MILPSQDTMVNNLVHWYNSATQAEEFEGMSWYDNAQRYARNLAGQHGLTLPQACGIIAVLSPRNRWEQNLIDAENVCILGQDAKVRTFRANLERAIRIKDNPDKTDSLVGGNKVNAFYRGMLGDDSAICVDTWAYRVAIDNPYAKAISITPKLYEKLSAAYEIAAQQVGISPREFQAIVWVSIRNLVTQPLWRLL